MRHLNGTEVFTGVAWKKKFKAPSEFGFALKVSASIRQHSTDMHFSTAGFTYIQTQKFQLCSFDKF